MCDKNTLIHKTSHMRRYLKKRRRILHHVSMNAGNLSDNAWNCAAGVHERCIGVNNLTVQNFHCSDFNNAINTRPRARRLQINYCKWNLRNHFVGFL